jgi:polyhydroxyalkanoate synthase
MSNGAHRDVWPEVAEWFLEQSDRPTLADVLGEGIEEALGVDVETDVTAGDADEMEIGLGDATGELARAVIARDAGTIEAFLEEALGVEIDLESGPSGIAVTVETADGVVTTVVEGVGEAIRGEVQEAVAATDLAASYDLEDIRGIGPTYAGRLRDAGLDSVAGLAVADSERVADVTDASEKLARDWIERARRLAGAGEPDGDGPDRFPSTENDTEI